MQSNRIFGLDILRSSAILLVILYHSKSIFYESDVINFKSFYLVGVYGVEIFFVLSGFLIGRVLISDFSNKKPSGKVLYNFWLKRWFRTLPNYYLFLCLNVILAYFLDGHGVIGPYMIKFIVFSQNFVTLKPQNWFFSEAWSLSIEEWFYFLFPLILFLSFTFVKNQKRALLIVIVIFLFIPFILRLTDFLSLFSNWNQARQVVVYRLDSIIWGVLYAFIFDFKNVHFNMIKRKNLLAISGLILITVMFIIYHFAVDMDTIFFRSIYLSIFPFSVFLILPFMLDVKEPVSKISRFVTLTASISYSMYLVHSPIIKLIIHFKSAWLSDVKVNIHLVNLLLFSGFIFLCWKLSDFLYENFEKPVMMFRIKYLIK